MNGNGMADNMADATMTRAEYGTGSIYQRASDGRWFGALDAGFTENGTRRRITVSAKTKTAVRRKLRDKRAELEAAGRQNVKRTITVAKWSAEWLTTIQTQVRPSAYETDCAAMKAVVGTIGHVRLAELTPADVRAVAAGLRARGKSTSTALRYQGSLTRMLTAAALEGYLVPPAVLLAKKPKEAVTDRAAMPFEHAIAALGAAALRPDGSRWLLAFLQGLRQAEALGLTWDAVDLDAGTLTISWQAKSLRYVDRANPALGFKVPDGYEARQLVGATHLVRPKTKAGWRVQPLVPFAVTALRAWREVAPANPHGLVWPGRTHKGQTWPRNPAKDREEWRAVQKAAGIAHPAGRPYVVHEIRHTTATLLLALRVEESVRVAIMGHSKVASTRAYEHVDLDQARAALVRVAAELGLGEPPREVPALRGVKVPQAIAQDGDVDP